ncbi:hypothetical protein KIW84_070787 [Lathyrus oleraceus]|uniref:Uncharacterized protein n=1 Tax=Pisum sativum TaxID=3888 RepID=A0A9D4VGL6_PEA|nr:hypothetical protein KIW84_070787 [Pisum sativum]
MAPRASLASPMCLAKVSTSLGTLPTPIRLASLASPVADTVISPSSGTLCAACYSTPLSTPMCHTEVGTSMNTFRANSTTLVGTTFPSTVALTKRGAPLSTLSASWCCTPLPPAMCFAKHGAPLCPFCTSRNLASTSSTMRDAKT